MLCEIFFDHKDEHNFRSARFKPVRTGAVIILLVSIVMNGFIFKKYLEMTTVWNACEKQLEVVSGLLGQQNSTSLSSLLKPAAKDSKEEKASN